MAAHYRNKNRRERREAAQIARGFELVRQADLARELGALAQMPEDTAEQVEEKRRRFEALTREGSAAFRLEQACDLWTAAWFLPKRRGERHAGADGLPRRGAETVPTSGQLRELLGGRQLFGPLIGAVTDAAEAHRFLHWPLAFAEVMARGGFDVVLGNPPWEVSQLGE